MKITPRKFLIIGATGLIGKSVCQELGSAVPWKGTVYKTDHPDFVRLDITDNKSVDQVMAKIKPTHVLLCANLSGGVEFCEKNPDVAKKWHFDGTVNVGEACLKYKARMLYISSECVFDGKKEVYAEGDKVNPINIYGEQKVKSEEWLKENLNEHIIVRTMSVFGWQLETKTPNALMKVYFSIKKGKKIPVPLYRRGTPTYVGDLAKAIIELSISKSSGTFHVTGSSYMDRYEWLKKSCAALGWDATFLVPEKDPPPQTVKYPLSIRLQNKKFSSSFQTPLHTLEKSLIFLKKDYQASFP